MRPVRIQQISPAVIQCVWDDGHEGEYTTEYLRAKCPCATCVHDREESERNRMFSLPLANQSQIKDIRASGNNAVVILWADGHSTGIYTWEYLRAICPCSQCGEAH